MQETVGKHLTDRTQGSNLICYTQSERRGFSLSDRYNVRPFSGKYSAVMLKRTKLREVYLSLTSSPTRCVTNLVFSNGRSRIVDGPRWKGVVTLAS